MDIPLLLARLVLSGVLLVSGTAKMRDMSGTREAVAGFGLPRWAVGAVATALPAIEILLGAGVLVPPAATASAVAVGTLLLLFTIAVVLNLARGRRPVCRCFGELSRSPVGWSTVIRNAALIGLAVFAVTARDSAGTLSQWRWLGDAESVGAVALAALVPLVIVVAVLSVIVTGLVRQNGRLLLRLDAVEASREPIGSAPAQRPRAQAAGLAAGAPAPAFQLRSVHGEALDSARLLQEGRPIWLVFADPNCGPCRTLLPDVALWQRQAADDMRVLVVSRAAEELTEAAGGLTVAHGDDGIFARFRVAGTPTAVLIRPDGRIGRPALSGVDPIRRLIAAGGAGLPAPQPVAFGGRLPDVPLRAADGSEIRLHDRLSGRVVILLWNAGCGFCAAMIPDLLRWEARRTGDAPKLLVVASGTPRTDLIPGLQSEVLFDDGFAVGRALGATGTPNAAVVNSGVMTAGPLAGADAVFSHLDAVPASAG